MTLARTMRLAAAAVAVVAIAAQPVAARDMAGYEVMGQAKTGDSATRTRALDRAFAAAVERALKDVLTDSVRRKHAAAIRKSIIGRARRHVVSYRVHKQQRKEGTLTIKVGVLIDRDKLRTALAELGIDTASATATTSVSKRPKIVVLLHANLAGDNRVTYGNAPSGRDGGAAGRAFIAELKSRGFDVVTATGTPPVSSTAEPGMPLDDAAATSLAKSAGAGGAFIVGIEVRRGGTIRGTKLKGATGRAQVRVLDVRKGKLVARATINGAGFGADDTKAAANAAAAVSKRTVDKVSGAAQRYWPSSPTISDGVAIVVRGDVHWAAVAKLLASLRAATDVSSASARRFRPGEVALVARGAIANLDKAAGVRRAAAIINAANLGAYQVKTATENGNTLAITVTKTKVSQ